jgi:hypothetical protein
MDDQNLSFDAAVAQFGDFLAACGYARKIVWLRPDDILVSGQRFLYVRVPVPLGNETRAHQRYDEGLAAGLGVLMSTICELRDSTCCHVWFPRDDKERQNRLLPKGGGPKMEAKTESARVPGKPVGNRFLWKWLQSRHREKQNLREFLFT